MQPGRLRAHLAVVGLNLLVLCVGVAGLELLFGNWFRPFAPPPTAIVDRSLTVRQKLYHPFGEISYVRDRYGLRGVGTPVENVELVTVGGSTTDQRYVGEGQTWQDVIHAATGMHIANAGVDGMTSRGHVYSVREWLHRIPNLHPRYYLHYVGINDSVLSPERWIGYRLAASPWGRWIRTSSAVLRVGEHVAAWIAGPADVVVHGRTTPTQIAFPEGIKAEANRSEIADFIETAYKPNLRRLLDLHQAAGERAVFVSQSANPALIMWRGDDVLVTVPTLARRAVALGMVNAATGAVCRERPDMCRYIDLAGRLSFEPGDFYDLFHTTPQGARKIGMFLAEALASLRGEWR